MKRRAWIGAMGLLAGWYGMPEMARADEAPGRYRVMVWNIHHGEGSDGKLDLERLARRIREQKPDVVLLQEVDRVVPRSGKVDQAAELARLTGMKAKFGAAMPLAGGEYGQAILSREELKDFKVHRLPSTGEPRIAVEGVMRVAGGEIRVVGVHLDHKDDAKRVEQATVLAKKLEEGKSPVVLGGDFNDVPGSEALKVFGGDWLAVPKLMQAKTHPAGNPTVEIDHLLVWGSVTTKEVEVVNDPESSDHRPLVMDFQGPWKKAE